MWSDAFLAERRGGVFNYDKNENGKDNNDKDDEDVNNDNKVDVWAGAFHWVSAEQGGKVTSTRMMMTCHINKEVDNNLASNNGGGNKKYNNNRHSMWYWRWT